MNKDCYLCGEGIGICAECKTEILEALSEDWKFTPNVGGIAPVNKAPHQSMTNQANPNGGEDLDKDNHIERYKRTIDASTQKTQKLKKKRQRDNYKLYGSIMRKFIF